MKKETISFKETGNFSKKFLQFIDNESLPYYPSEENILETLKGLNFSKRKPKLICVEIHQKNFKKHKIYRFLIKKKYKLIWHVSFSFLFKRK